MEQHRSKIKKQLQAFFLLLIIINSIPPYLHASISSAFIPKPQGFYTMHYLRPHDDFVDRCEQPTFVSGIAAYHQSTHGSAIAQALFGTDTLTIVGSSLTSIPTNIVADNIGLAPDFFGKLRLCPRIQSATFDFFYHINLSNFCESLFLELSAPLVFTRWTLGTSETIIRPGSLLFPSCYMSANTTTPVPTAPTMTEALSGDFLFGDMQEPWRAGKFDFEHRDRTRLADITIALGYNFYQSDLFRLSGSVLSIMPTGNHFQSTTVFSPLVGNGSHWTLGGSLTFNVHHVWNDCHTFDAYIMGTFTHLFDNQQRRTFDFIQKGPLSRYVLLEQFESVTTDGGTMLAYDNILINAVNFTTRTVEVACAVEGDIVAQFTYQGRATVFEVGYACYGRTQEHITLSCIKVPCDLLGHFYTFKDTTPVCAITAPSSVLNSNDLDTHSGEAPSAKVHTVFVQGGYTWQGSCAESAALIGLSGDRGTYGPQHALNEWGVWAQYRIRF